MDCKCCEVENLVRVSAKLSFRSFQVFWSVVKRRYQQTCRVWRPVCFSHSSTPKNTAVSNRLGGYASSPLPWEWEALKFGKLQLSIFKHDVCAENEMFSSGTELACCCKRCLLAARRVISPGMSSMLAAVQGRFSKQHSQTQLCHKLKVIVICEYSL